MPGQPSKPRHHLRPLSVGYDIPAESWPRDCDLKVGQRSCSIRAKTLLPERTSAMTLGELRPQIE